MLEVIKVSIKRKTKETLPSRKKVGNQLESAIFKLIEINGRMRPVRR